MIALSPRLVLVAMALPADLAPGGLQPMGAAGPLPAPLAMLHLPATLGGTMLLMTEAQHLREAGGQLALADGLRPAAEFILSPADSLVDLLGEASPARLLALLLFIARGALGTLRARDDQALAATCHRLAMQAHAHMPALPPAARCSPGLALYAPPQGFVDMPAYLLTAERIARRTSRSRQAMLLHSDLAGAILLEPQAPHAYRLDAALAATAELSELPRQGDAGAALFHAGMAELAMASGTDPRATAYLRALTCLAPAAKHQVFADPQRPVGGALELALDDHGGGLFLRGWLRDPLELVASAQLRSAFVEEPFIDEQRHAYARPDLAKTFAQAMHGGAGAQPGFVAWLPQLSRLPQAQWTLRLHLANGERLELISPPGLLPPQQARNAILGGLPLSALTAPMLDDAIIPAVSRAHAAFLAARGASEVVRIGISQPGPGVSVVVPLYRNMRFIRFQLGHFARDPAMRETELIYVLDSPEQRAEVEHLFRSLHALYRRSVTLVVQAGNYGFASACNAGAAIARAPRLLMLNSDVIPAARGWLPVLNAALDSDAALFAVGPKLLTEDGSVQHGGLFFERHGPWDEWYNNHYWKGAPRHFPALDRPRRVPGITGAATLLDRARFEQVGGFTTEYVIGDYEDSDLCLKLRGQGGEIGYEPRAELFHFERQSIRDHAVHDRNIATAYNRRIHQARWDQTIEALMARPEFQPGGLG